MEKNNGTGPKSMNEFVLSTILQSNFDVVQFNLLKQMAILQQMRKWLNELALPNWFLIFIKKIKNAHTHKWFYDNKKNFELKQNEF